MPAGSPQMVSGPGTEYPSADHGYVIHHIPEILIPRYRSSEFPYKYYSIWGIILGAKDYMKLRGSFVLKLYLCLVVMARAAAPTTVPTLSANPPAVDFQYSTNGETPQSISVTVTASNGTTPAIAETLTPASGTPANLFSLAGTGSTTFQVGINVATLDTLLNQPGVYTATITVSAPGFSNLTIPVALGVNASISIAASPAMLSFSAPAGATVQTVALTGTSNSAVAFSVTSSTAAGSWLSVTTSANVTPATLTVTVNPSTLGSGVYSGSITVTPDSVSLPLGIPVTLVVGSNTLAASPVSLAFEYTLAGTTPPVQVVQLSSTAPNNTFVAQAASTGNWLLVNGVTANVSGPLPASLDVTVNPAGLTAGTYQGTITATDAHGSTQSIAVTLVVNGVSSIANPAYLSFVAEENGLPPMSQTITVTGFANASFTATVTAPWLSVSAASGPAPAQIIVSARPTGLAAGTYTGSVQIDVDTHIQDVAVTFVVSANPVLTTNTGDYIYNYFGGNPPPSPLDLDVNVSSGSPQTFTVATGVPSWLEVNTGGPTATTPAVLAVTLLPQTLGTGTYVAQIVLLPASGGPPVTVPVVLMVVNATAVIPSSGSLAFTAVAGGPPQSQTVQISAASTTAFTAAASTTSGGTWLTVAPASGTVNTVKSPLTVTADATSLGAGTYQGAIKLTTSTGVITVIPVMFTVGAGSGTPVTISPSALTFAYTQNGPLPVAQNLQITGSETFTAGATTTSGGSWLAVMPVSGTGNTVLSVSVAPVSLAPGTYNGAITVTPSGSAAQTVPITLTVSIAGILSATPTPLAFAYAAGNPAPAPQAVSVTSSGPPIQFTATASSSGWLSVTPASATTPATLSVSVSPTNLGPGTYTGSVALAGGAGVAALSITVTLTVTAPQPVISRVVNAASFLSGGISPGEIVTVFGVALGPSAGVGAQIKDGFIQTNLANVQVTFNGYAAPILYAGSGQVNAIVPYELASASNASVVAIFGAAKSSPVTVQVVSSAPGIFSADASGMGPGAILDVNYHLVSSSNPVSVGDSIQVFATGQGQTSPAGVDGLIEPSVLPLPVPLLTAAGALVGGIPANITYVGAAPGLVAGALQVNIVIPPGVPSGPAQLILSIGGNSSQNGITVAVQ